MTSHLSMKSLLALSALLLSALPAVADDLVYLKCTGTVQWGEIKPSGETSQETEEITLYFKIDTKEKFYIDSNNPENLHKVKIWNGMVFEQFTDFKEPATGIMNTQIAYDPPGKIISKTTMRGNNTSVEYTHEVSGICEASDAASYEASK